MRSPTTAYVSNIEYTSWDNMVVTTAIIFKPKSAKLTVNRIDFYRDRACR
jgi:hypothetical protein